MAKKRAQETNEIDEDVELTAADIERYRLRLIEERDDIVTRSLQRAHEALDETLRLPDEVDQASTEHDQAFQLRLANKDRKLLNLIEHALDKIERGDFGICEGTGEPIPRPRLELRPWARYSVEYKQQLEKERALHVEEE